MNFRHRLCVLALAAILSAALAPPVVAQVPAATVEHDFAIPPVAGDVERAFDPPLTRYSAGHRGVDLDAEPGEPVVAAMSGTVTFSGLVAGVGWVTVSHGGELDTTYGPLAPRLVNAGTVVTRGEILGLIADDATHLDWGARFADDYIDPLTLLVRWETYLTTEDADDLPPLGGVALSASASPRGSAVGPRTWPAAGPLTSGFGTRVHPITGAARLHAGIDIGAPTGTGVVAAAAGTVQFAGVAGGYGNTVIIDHSGGTTTLYAHLSSISADTGTRVEPGQRIGAVGSTGLSTGPHLHFEVRVSGAPTDPRGWLPRK